jgi:hypothetical protein
MADQFRDDNTDGYSADELAELNAAWARISRAAPDPDGDWAIESMLDNWSETLLAEYDSGKRGEDLVAWFYAP